MGTNQPANPEHKGYNQHEEAGTELVISVSVISEDRFRTLRESVVSVPMLLGMESKLNKYFQPRIMSFGPLHYDKNLEQGRQFKHQLTKSFINDTMSQSAVIYNNIFKEIESFKKCYDQQELLKKFSDEDLAWMFFVDGCALIQLVHCWFQGELIYDDIADDQMDLILTRDLLLLENQLPLGVLNLVMGFSKEGGELYQNDHPVGKQSKEFRQSICRFIKIITKINFQIWENGVKADSVSFNKADHLLGLIWMNVVKEEKDYRSDTTLANSPHFSGVKDLPRIEATSLFRGVKDLQAAGIILEPNNSSSSLRDISFKRGNCLCKLKIPSFRVSKQGKFLVFNLIAFEMRPNFGEKRVVTSYISFLNSLVETKKDVAELRKAEILFNYRRNDKEVLKIFQELTSSLTPYSDIFSSTKVELIEYLNDKKRIKIVKWINEALEVYFRSPWTTIGVVSATILLILTIIQTIFSVLAHHR